MSTPQISIIVPVYNVEKYLHKCIKSLQEQTFGNIEIILINDGSTDNSLSICRFYEKKDKRIRVISQVNKGVAAARNKGIMSAQSSNIMFVDSDDYVSKDYCYTALKKMEEVNADILMFDIRYLSYKKRRIGFIKEKQGYLSKSDAMLSTIYNSYLMNKIFKKKLFKKIKFPNGKNYEDVATLYRLFDKASVIYYLPKVLYYYTRRENSIVHEFNNRNALGAFEAELNRYYFLKKRYPKIAENCTNNLISSAFSYLVKNPEGVYSKQANSILTTLKPQKGMAKYLRVFTHLYNIYPTMCLKCLKLLY